MTVRFIFWCVGFMAGMGIMLSISACRYIDAVRGKPVPQTYEGRELAAAVGAIPSNIGLAFSGLSFYQGRLYVSSNIGVFKISDNEPMQLLVWYPWNDVVSGPWVDRSRDRLWVLHDALDGFYIYDGVSWMPVDQPTELNRGDRLTGYSGLSNQSNFWMQASTGVWHWNKEGRNFEPLDLPPIICSDYPKEMGSSPCFASLAPTDRHEFVIMHTEHIDSLFSWVLTQPERTPRPLPDRVFLRREGEWIEVSGTNDPSFISKRVVTTPSVAYVLAYDGTMFKIDENAIEKIEPPGQIEAMASTPSGNLIASVRHKGIFRYNDQWTKIFDCPYPQEFPIAFAYLAGDESRVALAAVPEQGERSKDTARAHLWVSKGERMVEIQIEGN